MRRCGMPAAPGASLALAGALLLGGCKVDVDGAPCRGPGTTADCPDGQACGNDLRCSGRALACASSRCAPGATECIDATNARRCDGAADAVCGRWVANSCAARDPACRIVADPAVLWPDRIAPPPTGIPQPPECRFGRLGDALAAAAERAPAAATVWIEGEAGVAAAFGAVTKEEWPLMVATNVTVVTASAQPTPVIRGEPGVATNLAVQGTLEGVRVEGGGATGVGVELSCGVSGNAELRRVSVDGGGVHDPDGLVTAGLSAGVTVSGACGARLSSVEVSGVAGPALTISVDPALAATVDVLGGSFSASNAGIWIAAGKVNIGPDPEGAATTVEVSGNSRAGVVIGALPPELPLTGKAVDATLQGMWVAANGGTGIVLKDLSLTASQVHVTRCDLTGNGKFRAVKYGPGADANKRTAGGVLVSLGAIPFTFAGNRVWANAGDQLAFESDAAWSIAAPSDCGADTNVFDTCMSADSCNYGFGVDRTCAVALSGPGSVQADFNVWQETPPDPYMTASVSVSYYCNGKPGAPARPACP